MTSSRVALIGSPLRRRHSQVMHDAAFARFGIDARYELIDLPPSGLDDFFVAAREPDWMGFQVTAPHKQEALRRCDEVEPTARRIGAVNSVQRRADGSLFGFNTDVRGFLRSVGADLGRDLKGAAVVVAGAGGAARAVVYGCLDGGASRVTIGTRSLPDAERLASETGDDRVVGASLDGPFRGAVAVADLAVNATTVGMTSPGMAFDPSVMKSGSAVFDLVYVPDPTPLVDHARTVGLDAVNGLGMLVSQAEAAFAVWTGIEGVGPIMRAALRSIPASDGA